MANELLTGERTLIAWPGGPGPTTKCRGNFRNFNKMARGLALGAADTHEKAQAVLAKHENDERRKGSKQNDGRIQRRVSRSSR